MFFCLGTEGFNGSLFRNGWFEWFSVWELKVPMVPYLEMGGSDRKSTRLNSSHTVISYAVFCLKKKNKSSITYVINSALTTLDQVNIKQLRQCTYL